MKKLVVSDAYSTEITKGPKKGEEIYIVKLTGTRVTALAAAYTMLGIKTGSNKSNIAVLVLDDTQLGEMLEAAGFDAKDSVEELKGMEYEGLDIKVILNPESGKGRLIEPNNGDEPFRVETQVVLEGEGGVFDNRNPKADDTNDEEDEPEPVVEERKILANRREKKPEPIAEEKPVRNRRPVAKK